MNQEQLRKAISDGAEFEYLFDNGQWLPAMIEQLLDSSSHAPYVTIQLLLVPPGHSGIIRLNANGVQHRLRIKSSN